MNIKTYFTLLSQGVQYIHPTPQLKRGVLLFEYGYGHEVPHFTGNFVYNNLRYTLNCHQAIYSPHDNVHIICCLFVNTYCIRFHYRI